MITASLYLVVKDVPSEQCMNCGEDYFTPDVTQTLLDMLEEVASMGAEVVVRHYTLPAAPLHPRQH